MKRLIFPDEALNCECGFKGNLKQMEKHFKNTWTFVNYSSPLRVDKNGHYTIDNFFTKRGLN